MSETGAESPLTTSVWHRPLVPQEAKDRQAQRQANAAVALLRLGREDKVWPFLQHRPDPRTRSYLVHRFGPLDADPAQVLAQLDTQTDDSVRRALILVLGEFGGQQLPPEERARLAPRLLQLYADDPDPGVHGAAAWTLRQWGRQPELQAVDRRFATGKAEGSRLWYVNRQGKTMVIIPAPGEVVTGSPPHELGREDGPEGDSEMQRYVRIDAAFALATQQVTVAEFLQFRKDFYYRKYFSPEPGCPINNVSWYDAVAYCNWLNEQEGIPKEQWCYLPNEQGEYAQGMKIVPDFLRRIGYRLPTEAEWEYACRAGAVTSRFYGQNLDLDNHYVCSVQNALGRRTALGASFKPNDLGLFDMLGNNLEWSQSVFRDQSKPMEDVPKTAPDVAEVVRDQPMRALRSSTPCHPPETMRIAYYEAYPSNANVLGTSLRVGRTCLPDTSTVPVGEMRNEARLTLRGSGCFHCSEQMRVCYKTLHRVNFRLFGFGVRTARTITEWT